MLGGGIGRIGRSAGGLPPQLPDFTIEYQTITNGWNEEVVAILRPNAAALALGVRFELPDEDAGLAVVNG